MNAQSVALEAATIRQQCKVLRMPTIAAQCTQLAEQAVRERRTHLGYLEALLQAELEEREQRLVERRLREARLPRLKTLAEFDFGRNPKVSAQQIHELARGDYIVCNALKVIQCNAEKVIHLPAMFLFFSAKRF